MNSLQNPLGWRSLLRPDYRGVVALSVVVGILWVIWLTGHANSGRISTMRCGAVVLAVWGYCLALRARGNVDWVIRVAQALALVGSTVRNRGGRPATHVVQQRAFPNGVDFNS